MNVEAEQQAVLPGLRCTITRIHTALPTPLSPGSIPERQLSVFFISVIRPRPHIFTTAIVFVAVCFVFVLFVLP